MRHLSRRERCSKNKITWAWLKSFAHAYKGCDCACLLVCVHLIRKMSESLSVDDIAKAVSGAVSSVLKVHHKR